MNNELGEYAIRAGPAIGATSFTLIDIPLQDWVYIVTIVYTVVQTGLVLWDRVIKPRLYGRKE